MWWIIFFGPLIFKNWDCYSTYFKFKHFVSMFYNFQTFSPKGHLILNLNDMAHFGLRNIWVDITCGCHVNEFNSDAKWSHINIVLWETFYFLFHYSCTTPYWIRCIPQHAIVRSRDIKLPAVNYFYVCPNYIVPKITLYVYFFSFQYSKKLYNITVTCV